MKFPAAVLFDLDDTILATDCRANVSWRETCARVAMAEPALDADTLYREIQAQRAWYWSDLERHRAGRLNVHMAREEIAAYALTRLGVHAPALPPLIASTFHALSRENIAPFPGALETLAWFHDRGVPLGLITNGGSATQRWKIDRFDLAKFFGVIVVEEEFGAGKPDPSVFHHAVSALGVAHEQTWMVGDRLDWDVAPPQLLGIHGIWNDFRKAGLPANSSVRPARIVHAIAELAHALNAATTR